MAQSIGFCEDCGDDAVIVHLHPCGKRLCWRCCDERDEAEERDGARDYGDSSYGDDSWVAGFNQE